VSRILDLKAKVAGSIPALATGIYASAAQSGTHGLSPLLIAPPVEPAHSVKMPDGGIYSYRHFKTPKPNPLQIARPAPIPQLDQTRTTAPHR